MEVFNNNRIYYSISFVLEVFCFSSLPGNIQEIFRKDWKYFRRAGVHLYRCLGILPGKDSKTGNFAGKYLFTSKGGKNWVVVVA